MYVMCLNQLVQGDQRGGISYPEDQDFKHKVLIEDTWVVVQIAFLMLVAKEESPMS
jgi:hypothetical protein